MRVTNQAPMTPASVVGAHAPQVSRPALDADLRSRLLLRLDAATARPSADAMAALRSAVTDVVDHLKADGASAEEVVAVVDALLRERGLGPPTPVLHVEAGPAPQGGVVLYVRLLEWCVRAYQCDDWW